MKILVIFTGGTIGSRLKNGWIGPDKKLKYILINNYIATENDDVEFVPLEPYSLLSENLTSEEINILIKTVGENLQSDYDGIIITHGTDTLQYSAAALNLMLGDNSLPVVLVSANKPLCDPDSNGNTNFKAAVNAIKQGELKGVWVAYKNDGEDAKLHRGADLLSHAEGSDSITSCSAHQPIEPIGSFNLCDDPKLLVIDVHPGDGYNYSVEKYNAVIIKPYHSGTLNTNNKNFIEFCNAAAKHNIPVFVTNVPEGELYESSKEYEKLNIIPLKKMPFVLSFVKLWIAVSMGKDLKEIM